MKIQIDEVQIKLGRREADAEHIQELADSILELGLLNPVTVDKDNALIAGLHRLEAAKLLGWTEIECTVSSLEGLPAELAEIDENFVRSDLSVSEYGDLLLRRKEIYETLHPETKRGAQNQYTKVLTEETSVSKNAFAVDTAKKLGVTPRTIERKIQAAKNLTPEAKEIVKEKEIGFENALKISRLEPEQQKEAATLLAAKEIKSVDEYTAAAAAEPEVCMEPKEEVSAPVYTAEPEAKKAESPFSSIPYTLPENRCTSLKEMVAELKDADKDCSCTPDFFLAEYSAFVQKFNREIKWYSDPQYEVTFSVLSAQQMDYLRQLTDSVRSAAENLYKQIERKITT